MTLYDPACGRYAPHNPNKCEDTTCSLCRFLEWDSKEMEKEMEKEITMNVGGWILEWSPTRPNSVWAIPERLKTIRRTDSGILYDDGTMGWCYPDSTPAYVRRVAPQFIRKCQGKRVAK